MSIQTRQVRQGGRIWDNNRNSGKVRRPLEFSKDSNVIVFFPDVVYVIGRSGRHPDIWMKSRTGHFKCSRLTSSRRDPSAFFFVDYDRGQKEISDLLKATFEEIFKPNVEMRLAFQYEYKLLQVADYICTMEYSKKKWDTGRATNSEITFFGSRRLFIKRYYAGLRKLKF